MRWGMVIDLSICTGCGACAVACKRENATPPGVFWSRVHIYETGTYPDARLRSLPTLCMQCDEPPCEKACPTGATWVRTGGIVLVNNDQCIGCGYCTWACPYESRSLNYGEPQPYHPAYGFTPFEQRGYISHGKGVVEKCTFCAPRIDRGEQPACVQTCPARARVFGDLDDPESDVSRLIVERDAVRRMEELGTRPKVFYLHLREQLAPKTDRGAR
ncbi:MAG: 4Fe-4S dicluster domain-containing protein [Thermoleophilia bacterium]